MKAIVIDAVNKKVYPTNIGEYTDYYKHLDCQYFTVVQYPFGDVYVDDEGIWKDNGFRLPGYHPLFGNGVLTGPVDDEGENTDVALTIEQVLERVVWV